MTFEAYSVLFREKAIAQDKTNEYIDACLKYAEKLFTNNLPIIYNLEHFSLLVGYNENYIKRAVRFPRSFYYSYKVPKKSGKGEREISQPYPSLKEIQHWILNNILHEIPVSPFAKAYVRKKKLKENVRFHKNRKIVIACDLADFFHSIKKETIEHLFVELGYSKHLSNLLSKLTTFRGALPQGAPTSPCLSNLVMIKFDKAIADFCKSHNLFYTRYADDLTFSSNSDIDVDSLFDFINVELKKMKLDLNSQKTRFMNSNMRQIVTGVVVNEKIQVPVEYRKELRKEMFYIRKYGFESHLEKLNCKNAKYYIRGLMGRINFALQINPNDRDLVEYKKECSDYFIKNIPPEELEL